MGYLTDTEFQQLIDTIRKRPEYQFSGYWFNIIKFGDLMFVQGCVDDDDAPYGLDRNIVILTESIAAEELEGYRPEIEGHPVDTSEEALLVEYLSSKSAHDVELIVPERNTAHPVAWSRFDATPEYRMYNHFIYPVIIEVIESIESDRSLDKPGFCPRHTREGEIETNSSKRLLDMGCGCGNLIEVLKQRLPRFHYYGIDINPANVDAAKEKNLPNIRLGDSEDIGRLFPPALTFDFIIFSGLLNRQVTSRDKAFTILCNAIKRLSKEGYVIITGYTSCHFTASDLTHMGLDVLRKSIPHNLFKDYTGYYLRQLYLGQKMF